MQIILLSGGSGKRLWPLSNDSYSKQFLRFLTAPDGKRESMLQRIVRQIKESGVQASVTVAIAESQRDVILNQLGNAVNVVTEPDRRDTFPAISLAAVFLEKEKLCDRDETVVVIPCDPYTVGGYYQTICKMAEAVERNVANLVLMGVRPTRASSKYGYIVPCHKVSDCQISEVSRFIEKPDRETAEKLIEEGALWNGGVFAFRLGYVLDFVRKYVPDASFREIRQRYAEFPKISFDYEVAEKADSVAVIPFSGEWRDIGTWNALTEILDTNVFGNAVVGEDSENTHVINNLDVPLLCIGTKNLIVAAGHDGILVADKDCSESVKSYVSSLSNRPMYEERRWGTYKVIDRSVSKDGCMSLMKHLLINAGANISYQRHLNREEIWTFIDGEGQLIVDDERRTVRRGDVVHIAKGQKHAVKAVTDLHIIEVQIGSKLTEEDIERYWLAWPD